MQIATDAVFTSLSYKPLINVTSNALRYCHPIPCQLKLSVGGSKSISHGATGGLHGQGGLVLQCFLLSTEFRQRLVSPITPLSLLLSTTSHKIWSWHACPSRTHGKLDIFPCRSYKFIYQANHFSPTKTSFIIFNCLLIVFNETDALQHRRCKTVLWWQTSE